MLGDAKRENGVLYVFRYMQIRFVVVYLNFRVFKSDLTLHGDWEVVILVDI
jgi:hypothetical protein